MKQPNNYLRNWSLVLLSSFLLSSCGLFKAKEIEVPVPFYVEQYVPIKEMPDSLALLPTHFDAVSDKNLPEYLEANKFRNGGVVFIALDVPEYENLALNVGEFKRYIDQLIAIIDYYEVKLTKPEVPVEIK